ncbi:ferritin-like domain-containing protein [Hymenobacter properus]|uniref:Ferritin-like domain-containing protein n=1 Tax=Hymenobacter properus TaxID=2791026 RepID=A0A931BIE3_9BACT|nr:ferritin-like domain-containing protein [Hymenobacter properus]MBF9142847.1 ferritin-like domain-containing protein [Hymenobacter properus]MBR7721656.1 ferritin-like domain-containing protein [Microvirga sp. SRT04]
MNNPHNYLAEPAADPGHAATNVARRDFLRYSGAGLAVGGLWLAGCSKDSDTPTNNGNLLDVGSGDTGVLNYAYALEQLEAAFYAQVVAGGYFSSTSTSAAEKAIFNDLKDHEAIHAAFFKNALGSAAIKALTPDFSNIDFSQRTTTSGKLGVLNAAKAFEDLGVAAYNGAGRYISDNNYLTLAGKIVSVEARHAALIRELLGTNTFVDSDVVDITTTGMEKSKKPKDVLAIANTFLADGSKLSANKLN